MAALPTDFLKTLIADVAALKGLKDAAGNIKENDPTVGACARLAYLQVCKASRRSFHWGARTDYYDTYTGPLLLRSVPVDIEKPIKVVQQGVELSGTEFAISRNRLVLFGDATEDPGNPRYPEVELWTTAGIKLCEDNNTLFTAVQIQTIANYHRRDMFGLSETSGEKGIARRSSDSGELIESARILLEDLFYPGVGYSMDGD